MHAGRVVGCSPVKTVINVSAAWWLQVISNSPLEYFSKSSSALALGYMAELLLRMAVILLVQITTPSGLRPSK